MNRVRIALDWARIECEYLENQATIGRVDRRGAPRTECPRQPAYCVRLNYFKTFQVFSDFSPYFLLFLAFPPFPGISTHACIGQIGFFLRGLRDSLDQFGTFERRAPFQNASYYCDFGPKITRNSIYASHSKIGLPQPPAEPVQKFRRHRSLGYRAR